MPGKTILDSTSGNTGIALAMIGAALGYPVELVMPDNVSRERKQVVAAFGAEIDLQRSARGLRRRDPALPRRSSRPTPSATSSPTSTTTRPTRSPTTRPPGPEIWRQTEGRVTHFVAGIGTGGTIMGTGRYLKERNPAIQVVAAEPEDAFHGLEGLKHMASRSCRASTTRTSST